MRRPLFLLFLVWLMMLETRGAITAPYVPLNSPTQPKRLLILHSYHQGLNWTDAIQAGILESLAASGQRYEVYTEYLDSLRFPQPVQTGFADTATRLHDKYQSRQPDVVLVSDNHAYDFMLAHRDRIAPGKPLVFCGVNNLKPQDVAGLTNLTGVSETPSFLETLQLIRQIQPKVVKLLVISDNSVTGQANQARIREALRYLGEPFITEYWTDGQIDRAETLLSQQTPETAVLLVGRQTDTDGNIMETDLAATRLVQASPVPIYSSHDFWIGPGTLGGKVIDGGAQGRLAGQLAARLLNGEPIEKIQIVWESPNQYLLDYAVLQRFGLENANLPQESRFVNRQPGFFEAHRTFALSAGGVIVSLMIVVLILAMNNQQRKLTEHPVRILLAEDDEDHAELARRTMRVLEPPCELAVAGSLQAARAWLDRHIPDLLIADLRLPDGSGVDLLRSAHPLPYPVIIMTSQGDERMVVAAMKAGAMDYIVKSPDTFRELARIAQRTLREWWHIAERQGRFIKPSGQAIGFKGVARPRQLETEIVFEGMLLDITGKKQAEEALRDSEERFRSIWPIMTH